MSQICKIEIILYLLYSIITMDSKYLEIIFTSSVSSVAFASIIYIIYKYVYHNSIFTNIHSETLNNYVNRHHENNHGIDTDIESQASTQHA